MGCHTRPSLRNSVVEKFWSLVRKTDRCWLWCGWKGDRGYGRFVIDGVRYRSHRLAWWINGKEIPDGMLVCHRCDEPSCVKPDHLFVGTSKENTRDMVQKGRAHWQLRPSSRPPRNPRSNGPRTNLSCRSVSLRAAREIRTAHRDRGESLRSLASRMGIGRTAVWRIVHDQTYRDEAAQ